MPTRSLVPIDPPDLSARPLRLTVEREMQASPESVFRAWTQDFEGWLAAPGTVLAQGEPNTVFYFETHQAEHRAPYYGRFIRLEPGRKVEMTWLSLGTGGTETVITIELAPRGSGTRLRFTQAGFLDETARDEHEAAWPFVLEQLDQHLMKPGK